MVLLERSELPQIFATAKAAVAENVDTPTVLVLASHSIDSLAATTILTRLFEDELIAYKVVSLTDYGELSRVYREEVVGSSELRSIFTINCGGIIDLMGHFQQALDEEDAESNLPAGTRSARELPHEDCKWYVMDSHRPYALENVHADPHDDQPPNVFVIHDGEPNEDLDDILAQLPILYDDPDGGDEESDEEDDYEPPTQRRRVSMREYGGMSPGSQHDRRKWLKKMLKRYYSSSWHGTASSLLCYSLVTSLNKAANDLLWLAIVGLTDQLVHERIEYERYVGEAQVLQAEVGALNQDGGDEVREVAGEDGGPTVSVRQHIQSRMRIDSVQELRLSLMRHWTVYEALHHSPYIASRLGLYQQAGRDRLDVWLARMGIPLDECKQEYQYMRKQFKAHLFERMLQYGNEFGLVHLTYPSFRCVRSFGNTQLAAADLVSGVAAVLENYSSLSPEAFPGGAFAAAQSALKSGMRDGLERAMREHGGMRDAIDRAKEMLRATVSVGHAVLTARDYVNYGDFYSVTLKAGGDVGRFTQPLALTKLALFLSDALREGLASLRNAPSKPLLIAAPSLDATPPSYLVVAVLGSSRCWKSGRNGFGAAFAKAAEMTKAHMAHDGFDSSVCKVASDDFERFHEHLVLEIGRS